MCFGIVQHPGYIVITAGHTVLRVPEDGVGIGQFGVDILFDIVVVVIHVIEYNFLHEGSVHFTPAVRTRRISPEVCLVLDGVF